MFATTLTHRGVVAVSGPEARAFLDRLLTNHVSQVTPERPCHAALLTPQGKMLVEMIVSEVPAAEGGGFLLDCLRAHADTLASKLAFYRLRAKVEIADVSAAARVVAIWGAGAPGGLPHALADPRHPAMGFRAVLDADAAADAIARAGASPVEPREWHRLRIACAVPEPGEDYVLGDTYPHEADMDQLGGLDFAKGCYIGQEVVSRMEHRTSARSRVVPVEAADGGFLAEGGLPVTAGELRVGTMGSSVEGRGLALLRLDRAAEALAAGTPLVCGGVTLVARKPDWATFEVPGT